MPNTVTVVTSEGVPVGTYGTIQAAIDASSDGCTITASAGTYSEHVSLNKAVTLNGANLGIDGAALVRGAETVITGGVEITADDATLDGVKINGSFASPDFQRTGLRIEGANATIQNSALISDGSFSRGFYVVTGNSSSPTGLSFADNLVQDWYDASATVNGSGSITGNTFKSAYSSYSLDHLG
jgi:hypothetical protein